MIRGACLILAGLAAPFGARAGLAAESAGDNGFATVAGLEIALIAVAATAIVVAFIAAVRLRRAHALHQDILAAVPQPRQVVGSDGRTLLANPAFHEFFGGVDLPTPDLLAREIVEDADARERLARLEANARKGVAGTAELPVRARPDAPGPGGGKTEAEWRHVAAYPLAGQPGAVLWLVDDITVRRQMEAVIHEEQARFVDLLEHAPIGFYSVDGEGNFLFANQTLCHWLGLTHSDLESGHVRLHDLVATPLPAGTPAHNPFGGRAEARGEVDLKGSDGRRFEASISQDVVQDEAGRVLRTRSVVRHLSRERAMAEALQRSVQRFERFFLEAPVGIALLEAEGRVTECNRTFCALAGRSEGELAETRLLDLVRGADHQAVTTALARAERGDAEDGQAPIDVHFAGEAETACSMYLNGMENAEGTTTGFIAHFIDTTEQKNLEVQFSQSQKMQAVGQLAGGVAHDFNNLLTAMIGFSDLLLLRHRPGDQSFADIMQIKQNANRAANLVRQLLAFSRQQTLQPRLLDVTDILAELSHLLRRLIGENIELEMIHGRELGTVKADQGQLEQVIINLAVNARDAMIEGGKLTIRTSNAVTKREKKHKAEVMPPGDYVLIEVVDTGCGIARENLDRIFDPFFSTKEVGAGTGLGLSTVYGIVKQTGGFVFVESASDQGTTFAVYLPQHAASEAEAAAVETEKKASRDLTGSGRVLLVEDEDAVRAFGARALRNKGYEVLEARPGESALEVLKNESDSIDLLVTDVVMPRLDGPSLVREVRKEWPDLKVIFISRSAEDTFRQKLGEEAGIHFLPKPFSLKKLAAKVKEVMAEDAAPLGGPADSGNQDGLSA